MNRLGIFAALLIVLTSAFTRQLTKPEITKWVIIKGGFLRVDGSTNVNKFNCIIANYTKPDTLELYRGQGKEGLQMSGALNLDVQSFDCHHPIMTNDLRKTLKAKEFPKLVIKFYTLNRYPNLDQRQEHIKGMVGIQLAGVTRRFEVDYKVTPGSKGVINLIGVRRVNFTDFNIKPPRKIGGMIQTDNELDVVFELRLRVID